jgi:Ras-related protein Rab-8A
METSAKTSINVEEAFISLARDIKKKMDKKLENPNSCQPDGKVKVTTESKPKKKGFGCSLL